MAAALINPDNQVPESERGRPTQEGIDWLAFGRFAAGTISLKDAGSARRVAVICGAQQGPQLQFTHAVFAALLSDHIPLDARWDVAVSALRRLQDKEEMTGPEPIEWLEAILLEQGQDIMGDDATIESYVIGD